MNRYTLLFIIALGFFLYPLTNIVQEKMAQKRFAKIEPENNEEKSQLWILKHHKTVMKYIDPHLIKLLTRSISNEKMLQEYNWMLKKDKKIYKENDPFYKLFNQAFDQKCNKGIDPKTIKQLREIYQKEVNSLPIKQLIIRAQLMSILGEKDLYLKAYLKYKTEFLNNILLKKYNPNTYLTDPAKYYADLNLLLSNVLLEASFKTAKVNGEIGAINNLLELMPKIARSDEFYDSASVLFRIEHLLRIKFQMNHSLMYKALTAAIAEDGSMQYEPGCIGCEVSTLINYLLSLDSAPTPEIENYCL